MPRRTKPGSWVRRFKYKGRMLTIQELSEMTGIKAQTLHKRLLLGWSVERATTEAVRQYNRDA